MYIVQVGMYFVPCQTQDWGVGRWVVRLRRHTYICSAGEESDMAPNMGAESRTIALIGPG